MQEPINTVISLIDMLEDQPNNTLSDLEKKKFKYIHNASYRMKELVNALLDYGKLGQKPELKK